MLATARWLRILIAACSFAHVHSQTGNNATSKIEETCNPNSLAYFMVKTYQGTSFFDEFSEACGNDTSTFPFKKATVLTPALSGSTTHLESKADAESRRLAIPTFPKCGDLYACPPGPCTVYDINYQTAGSIDVTLPQFQFKSQGICGPAFGVQGIERRTNTLVPKSVDTETSESMPSLFEDGVLVFDPGSPSTAGYVPALGNIVNRNPTWYYKNIPAWETNSNDPNNLNQKSCRYSPTAEGQKGTHLSQPPVKMPEYTISEQTPTYGDLSSYIQTGNGYTDAEFVNVYPQTLDFNVTNNLTDFIDAQTAQFLQSCDLSQCSWLPAARPVELKNKISSGTYNSQKGIFQSLNCILIEYVRTWAKNWTPGTATGGYPVPISCFTDWSASDITHMNSYYNYPGVTKPASTSNGFWTDILVIGNADYNNIDQSLPFQCTANANRYNLIDLSYHDLNNLKDKRKKAAGEGAFTQTVMYNCFGGNYTYGDFRDCILKAQGHLENHKGGEFNGRGGSYVLDHDKIGFGMMLAYYWYFFYWVESGGIKYTNQGFNIENGFFAATDPSLAKSTEKYEPVQAAVGGYPPLVPNTFMTQNASILNDYKKLL